ncbi:unnamed protein product [marine sediment metagenome]|uniref:Rieske domain-containing protein n=1 Tax=marine sediment metagenome TaxID=412755 RepID=X0XSW0_9ZZZZ
MKLCALAALPDGAGREFELETTGPARSIFLVRQGNRVCGYVNRCPHRGTPLNWTSDHFLDREGRHIVCATHGAVFRIDDGACLSGPCVGESLERVGIEVRGEAVFLA